MSSPMTSDTAPRPPRRASRLVFSSPRGRQRYRRATDVFVLVPALLVLGGVVLAYPPSELERSLEALLGAIPSWLAPVWRLAYGLLALWAAGLLVVGVTARRHVVWLQALLAVGSALALSLVAARLAGGVWPTLDGPSTIRLDDETYPVLRVAACTAVALTVGPHLVLPLERLGRWIVALGVVGALLVEQAPPSATLTAVLVAVVAAAAVRLALGTSAGHPEPPDVVAALAALGVAVEGIAPAVRMPAGLFVADALLSDGTPVVVKVHGRDAYDTHLLEKGWRTLLYSDEGPRLRRSRIEAVEHEALLTLLARQAGVRTQGVVLAAESDRRDAFLVLGGAVRPLSALSPAELDDALLAQAWREVAALGRAGIAHHRIDPGTVALVDDAIGLVDLGWATAAAPATHVERDRAMLLATSAAVVGVERGIGAAVTALGSDGVAALLPYLQPAAFGRALRRALRAEGIDVDELREAAAAAAGVELPEPVRLRRVTWWTAAQLALLVFAVSTIVGALTGLDFEALRGYVEDASWPWLAAGLVVAQLPRLTQALSTLGSVPQRLPFVPVYVMQLATGYMNLALPSNLARMALNIRFFQRQGIPPTTAVTGGAIDSFVSTVAQAGLLLALLAFSLSDLELDVELPEAPSTWALVVVVGLGLAGVAVVVAVRRLREAIVGRVRTWWPEVRSSLAGLRAGDKLALLIGGSVATELLFASALGVFANAFGFDVGLIDLLVINISVSLLASFVPVPGGIGVAEFGLTVGLTAAGLPEEAALATALLYRFATFYLPPVWGFFAMRWLNRNALL